MCRRSKASICSLFSTLILIRSCPGNRRNSCFFVQRLFSKYVTVIPGFWIFYPFFKSENLQIKKKTQILIVATWTQPLRSFIVWRIQKHPFSRSGQKFRNYSCMKKKTTGQKSYNFFGSLKKILSGFWSLTILKRNKIPKNLLKSCRQNSFWRTFWEISKEKKREIIVGICELIPKKSFWTIS